LQRKLWKSAGLLLLGAALFAFQGNAAYAQVHNFSSGGLGHAGGSFGGIHGPARVPHGYFREHGFIHENAHVRVVSPYRSHHHDGYSSYGLYSLRMGLYAYPRSPYWLCGYPRGFRPRAYYVPWYHHDGRRHSQHVSGWHH
jgi:hypothetical protein